MKRPPVLPFVCFLLMLSLNSCSGATQPAQNSTKQGVQDKAKQTKTGVDQNSNDDDFEKPSIDVAGVNLVPNCVSADALKNSLESVNSQDVYEVNCSIILSKPATVVLNQPQLELSSSSGKKISLRESRPIISIPKTVKSVDLFFSTTDPNEAAHLRTKPKLRLSFDRISADGKHIDKPSASLKVEELKAVPSECPDPSTLTWKKQTLVWTNTLEKAVPKFQSEWHPQIQYVSPRFSLVVSKDKLPDVTKTPLCGARFSSAARKLKTDGSAFADGVPFYSDRLVFLLNSTVIAADDVVYPLGLKRKPIILRLSDPMVLIDKIMSNVLEEFHSPADSVKFSNRRYSDQFCLGTSAFCFDNPSSQTVTDDWVNEFSSFNPQSVSSVLLRGLIEKHLKLGDDINLGFHVFGNANADGRTSLDGFHNDLSQIEIDLELAF